MGTSLGVSTCSGSQDTIKHLHLHYLNSVCHNILLFSFAGSVPEWWDWRVSSSLSQCTPSSTHSSTDPHHHQCCFPWLPCLQAAATHQVSKEISGEKDGSRLADFPWSGQVHGTCHTCLSPSAQEHEDTDGSFEAAECCWGGTGRHSWGMQGSPHHSQRVKSAEMLCLMQLNFDSTSAKV